MSIEKVGLAKGSKVSMMACPQAGRPRPHWLALGGGGGFGGRCRGTRRSRGSRGWDEGVRGIGGWSSFLLPEQWVRLVVCPQARRPRPQCV